MSQLLVVFAASIFLLMGLGHGAFTLADLKTPRAFTPPDPALREAMQQSSVRFHPTINLWDAWMGFNLTHSLGLVLFGGAYVYLGIVDPLAFARSGLLQAVALIVSALYLILSRRFFFSKPVLGSALGLGGFALACLLAWI